MKVSFFEEIVLWHGVQPDPCTLQMLPDILFPNNKKELQSFLGIKRYLEKFSLATAEVCKLPRKPMSVKENGH